MSMKCTLITGLLAVFMFIGCCFSSPISIKPNILEDTTQIGVHDEGSGKLPGPIGSALAPVVGAVVGPLLVNIANGITNGITSSLATGYEPLDFGHDPSPFGQYNLYLVNFDGDSKPYLLLESIKKDEDESLQYYGAASTHNNIYTISHKLSTDDITKSTSDMM